ncbi:LIM and senescent cell antigen-like domains 2, partial [Silurus asotus]
IPENEELTELQMNGVQDRENGGEAEVPLAKSQRRRSDVKVYKEFCDFYARFNMANALANAVCELCKTGFTPSEKIVNSNGELYHEQCFVCAQCFQQFSEGLYYEFDDRKYCEHDFHMLFAPCCNQCGEFIIGRVIKAMNNSWHPECFRCNICHAVLADVGFAKNAGRHLCRPCHIRERACGLGKYICQKCHTIIDEQPLIFKSDPYHPDHFNCSNCGKVKRAAAKMPLATSLAIFQSYNITGVPKSTRCAILRDMAKVRKAESRPPLNKTHKLKRQDWAKKYLKTDFSKVLWTDEMRVIISALNKAWCINCFACSTCSSKLTLKDKFVELDLKPVCKQCYERMPTQLKHRLAKREHDSKDKRKKMGICL